MRARFELDAPGDLAGALAALAREPTAQPIAGGTNLVVDMRAGRERPERLVSLDRVAELRGFEIDEFGVSVGGRTTVSDILDEPRFVRAAPSLVESARLFGGLMVRNAATFAGNIASGSPAADLVPPLLSLDARLTLASRDGERVVPLDGYYQDYKRDIRHPDELITRISWPQPPEGAFSSYYKLARRIGDAITVVGVAVTLALRDGHCMLARIALASVAPFPLRVRPAEAMLEGNPLTGEAIDAAADAASRACAPIDDPRASADYRRHMAGVLVRRLLHRAAFRIDAARQSES